MEKFRKSLSQIVPRYRSFSHILFDDKESKSQKLKKIFVCFLTVTQNYVGQPATPFSATKEDLLFFSSVLFKDLDPNEKDSILAKYRSNSDSLEIRLKTTITGAMLPLSLTYSEFPYVFCKVWIHENEIQYLPTKYLTSVVQWKESLVFKVNNYDHDRIYYELCVSKVADRKKVKITTQKSSHFWNPFHLFEKDSVDMDVVHVVGRTDILISSLPCIYQEITLALQTLEEIPANTDITISVELYCKKTEIQYNHIHMHLLLIKLCYESQLSNFNEAMVWLNWQEILPVEALTLIHQHAIQLGFGMLEQTLCSWIVSSILKQHGEHRLSYALLHSLIKDMMHFQLADPLDDFLQKAYYKCNGKFLTFAKKQLENLHQNFEWNVDEGANELFEMLRCITLVEMENRITSSEEYKQLLMKEAKVWYYDVVHQNKDNLENKNVIVVAIKTIIKEFITSQIYLDDTFGRAWNINYSEITFNNMDYVISTTLKPLTIHLVKFVGKMYSKKKDFYLMQTLQIFHSFRNLADYTKSKVPNIKETSAMESYPEWFDKKMIFEWFLLGTRQVEVQIKRAVECDTMETMNEFIKYGTSLSDVVYIIDEMVVTIWLEMKWEQQFFTQSALTQAINICAINYINAVSKHIEKLNFFNTSTSFVVTKKLCVALSNVNSMFEHMSHVEGTIKDTIAAAEEEFSIGILDLDDFMQDKLLITATNVYLLVINKIKSEDKMACKALIHEKTEQAQLRRKTNFQNYVISTLEVLHCNLKGRLFYIILSALWINLVDIFYHLIKKKKISLFHQIEEIQILQSAMDSLENIFFCNGKGLSHFEMQNRKYKKLKSALDTT